MPIIRVWGMGAHDGSPTRTEIIRALIGGLMGSGMDLTAFEAAEDIAAAVQERLKC